MASDGKLAGETPTAFNRNAYIKRLNGTVVSFALFDAGDVREHKRFQTVVQHSYPARTSEEQPSDLRTIDKATASDFKTFTVKETEERRGESIAQQAGNHRQVFSLAKAEVPLRRIHQQRHQPKSAAQSRLSRHDEYCHPAEESMQSSGSLRK